MTSSRKRLCAALACGLVAALLFMFYANDLRAEAASVRSQAIAEYGGEQVEVLVATRDIAAGEVVEAGNASFQTWLVDFLPIGAVLDAHEAYGQTTTMPILKNEPILTVKLGEQATQIVVPEGLCAVSIPADDVQAVGGALVPGMNVDIYAVGATSVSLVAQDVFLLETSNGFGATTTGSASGSPMATRSSLKWVTVAVDSTTVQELLTVARDETLCLTLPGAEASTSTPSDAGSQL